MFATKRKLTQAPPILADYMYRMERFMQTSSDDRLKPLLVSCFFWFTAALVLVMLQREIQKA